MANTQANLVASFDAGIFTVSAQPVGVCIKFKLMNGEETLTHWPLMHFSKLIRIFEEYINHGRHQNFMFTVKQNSQLEEALISAIHISRLRTMFLRSMRRKWVAAQQLPGWKVVRPQIKAVSWQ